MLTDLFCKILKLLKKKWQANWDEFRTYLNGVITYIYYSSTPKGDVYLSGYTSK